VAAGGKINETLCEVHVTCNERGVDLTLRDGSIEFAIERAVGNLRRIVKARDGVGRTRHCINRRGREQCRSEQGGRNARAECHVSLWWFKHVRPRIGIRRSKRRFQLR
jgi:hypothetical protein